MPAQGPPPWNLDKVLPTESFPSENAWLPGLVDTQVAAHQVNKAMLSAPSSLKGWESLTCHTTELS